eukprot:344913-Pelagomonas_calceolata.AAC.1
MLSPALARDARSLLGTCGKLPFKYVLNRDVLNHLLVVMLCAVTALLTFGLKRQCKDLMTKAPMQSAQGGGPQGKGGRALMDRGPGESSLGPLSTEA